MTVRRRLPLRKLTDRFRPRMSRREVVEPFFVLWWFVADGVTTFFLIILLAGLGVVPFSLRDEAEEEEAEWSLGEERGLMCCPLSDLLLLLLAIPVVASTLVWLLLLLLLRELLPVLVRSLEWWRFFSSSSSSSGSVGGRSMNGGAGVPFWRVLSGEHDRRGDGVLGVGLGETARLGEVPRFVGDADLVGERLLRGEFCLGLAVGEDGVVGATALSSESSTIDGIE